MLVDILEQCDGDVAVFCAQFNVADHTTSFVTTLVRTLRILNRPGNEAFLNDWHSIIDAFKEAKMTIAQNNAMNFIADYKPRKGKGTEQIPLAQFIALTKMWAPEHIDADKRSKSKAADKGSSKLKGIFSALTGGEDDGD